MSTCPLIVSFEFQDLASPLAHLSTKTSALISFLDLQQRSQLIWSSSQSPRVRLDETSLFGTISLYWTHSYVILLPWQQSFKPSSMPSSITLCLSSGSHFTNGFESYLFVYGSSVFAGVIVALICYISMKPRSAHTVSLNPYAFPVSMLVVTLSFGCLAVMVSRSSPLLWFYGKGIWI